MVFKAYEYHEEYEKHLIPGPWFSTDITDLPEEPHPRRETGHAGEAAETMHTASVLSVTPGQFVKRRAQLFFVFYFFMTGLHLIHMVIGIGLVAWVSCWPAAAGSRRVPRAARDGGPLLALHRHRLGVPLPVALPGGPPQRRIPTAKARGFPVNRARAASSMAILRAPRARMFRAAFWSAFARCPHDTQRNFRLFRLSRAVAAREHVRDVLRGSTVTTGTPARGLVPTGSRPAAERPTREPVASVSAPNREPVADPAEVFKGDATSGAFGSRDDRLADAVVLVLAEPGFLAGDPLLELLLGPLGVLPLPSRFRWRLCLRRTVSTGSPEWAVPSLSVAILAMPRSTPRNSVGLIGADSGISTVA